MGRPHPATQPTVTRQRIITSPEHWEVAAVVPTVFPPNARDATHDRVMTYWPVDDQPTLVVLELSTQRVVKKLVPIDTASTDYALSPDGCVPAAPGCWWPSCANGERL